MTETAKSAYISAKAALKIASPSRLFKDGIGQQIMIGWAGGITEGAGKVVNAISDTVGKLTSTAGRTSLNSNIHTELPRSFEQSGLISQINTGSPIIVNMNVQAESLKSIQDVFNLLSGIRQKSIIYGGEN